MCAFFTVNQDVGIVPTPGKKGHLTKKAEPMHVYPGILKLTERRTKKANLFQKIQNPIMTIGATNIKIYLDFQIVYY